MRARPLLCWTLIACLALAAGAAWLRLHPAGRLGTLVSSLLRSRADTEAACRGHLAEAQTRALRAVDLRCAELVDFIESRKAGGKPFAKEVVSLRGKWRAVKPYLPFTRKDGQQQYITEIFNRHLFTPEDLAAAVRRAIEGSVKDLEAIENGLAVALRREIQDPWLALSGKPVAPGQFLEVLERMAAASRRDAAKGAGGVVAAEIAAQITTRVLVRLGISSGVLAVGAGSSWWTFGAGFVLGLAVDAVIEWIDNPEGDIEREILAALDQLSADASAAIREELRERIAQRGALWEQSLAEILP